MHDFSPEYFLDQIEKLNNREITPVSVVGRGYRDTRKAAFAWLIDRTKDALLQDEVLDMAVILKQSGDKNVAEYIAGRLEMKVYDAQVRKKEFAFIADEMNEATKIALKAHQEKYKK